MCRLDRIAATVVLALGLGWAAVPAAAAITVTDCAAGAPTAADLLAPSDACYTVDRDPGDSLGNRKLVAAFAPHVAGLVPIATLRPLPGSDNGVTLAGTRRGGTWSLSDEAFAAHESVLWFLKGRQSLPVLRVAYLTSAQSGSWITPFYRDARGGTCVISGDTVGAFCRPKNVARVRVFGVPSAVPLPAAGLLLLGALGGLALVRRRARPGS